MKRMIAAATLLLLSHLACAETYNQIIDAVGQESAKQGVPIHMVLAIAAASSRLRPDWLEPGAGTRGAGIFQITEKTAAKIAGKPVNKQALLNLQTSVNLGVSHMKALYQELGNTDKVIIAWWTGKNYFKKASNYQENADGSVVPLKGSRTKAWYKAVKAAEISWYAMFQIQSPAK